MLRGTMKVRKDLGPLALRWLLTARRGGRRMPSLRVSGISASRPQSAKKSPSPALPAARQENVLPVLPLAVQTDRTAIAPAAADKVQQALFTCRYQFHIVKMQGTGGARADARGLVGALQTHLPVQNGGKSMQPFPRFLWIEDFQQCLRPFEPPGDAVHIRLALPQVARAKSAPAARAQSRS